MTALSSSDQKTSGPYAQIDLSALCANYAMIDAATAGAQTAAVVKCNAYGIGMAPVARALCEHTDCRTFFVAYPEEGVALRQTLNELSIQEAVIYVFHGPLRGTLGLFGEARLTPVINSLQQARDWTSAYRGAPCALHIDTGMNRLGAPMSSVDDFLNLAGLNVGMVMSHLACGTEPDHPKNEEQRCLFDALSTKFPKALKSFSASAGALMAPGYHYDLIRLGIALYGGTPFDQEEPRLKPVVSLRAPVIQSRTVEAGETVGYSASYTARKSARIATIAIGYGDGLPVYASNTAMVAINGEKAPIVGRVSMDLTCIDVSNCANEVKTGDIAELFGHDVSLFETATACQMPPYELLTGLGGRVDRRYVYG